MDVIAIETMHKKFADIVTEPMDAVIYVDTLPEACVENIVHRDRPEERGTISPEYIRDLGELYDRYIENESVASTYRYTNGRTDLEELMSEILITARSGARLTCLSRPPKTVAGRPIVYHD